MKFISTAFPGLYLVDSLKFSDDRGFFSELYRERTLSEKMSFKVNFVQENFSFSKFKWTVRGLHYQAPPVAQGKLIRCSYGEIMDVVVDVRKNSPTYSQHLKIKLSDQDGIQLWVPEGFLHGFLTLKDNCKVIYKVTNYYSKEYEGRVLWNDPSLKIDWGIQVQEAILSEKDESATKFLNWQSPFD